MGSDRKKQDKADLRWEAVALVAQHRYAMAEASKNLELNAGLLPR